MWIETPWVLTMMALLPFLAAQRLVGRWPVQKLRTWLALIGASLLNWGVTPLHGGIPILQYVAIDALAAIVLIWPPASHFQRKITALFGVMVASHIGFALGRLAWGDIAWNAMVLPSHAHWLVNYVLGWVQLGLLAWWGGSDVGRYVRNNRGVGRARGDRFGVAGVRPRR